MGPILVTSSIVAASSVERCGVGGDRLDGRQLSAAPVRSAATSGTSSVGHEHRRREWRRHWRGRRLRGRLRRRLVVQDRTDFGRRRRAGPPDLDGGQRSGDRTGSSIACISRRRRRLGRRHCRALAERDREVDRRVEAAGLAVLGGARRRRTGGGARRSSSARGGPARRARILWSRIDGDHGRATPLPPALGGAVVLGASRSSPCRSWQRPGLATPPLPVRDPARLDVGGTPLSTRSSVGEHADKGSAPGRSRCLAAARTVGRSSRGALAIDIDDHRHGIADLGVATSCAPLTQPAAPPRTVRRRSLPTRRHPPPFGLCCRSTIRSPNPPTATTPNAAITTTASNSTTAWPRSQDSDHRA